MYSITYHTNIYPNGGSKIYAWGSAESSYAIPNAGSLSDPQKHIAFPIQISNHIKRGIKFSQICADTGNVFSALDTKGNAYVWGNSRFGFPNIPTPPVENSKFLLMAVGDHFIVGISKTYELMEWNLDFNKSSGSRKHSSNFKLVNDVAGKKIVDVAACGQFILIVIEEEVESVEKSTQSRMQKNRRLYMRFVPRKQATGNNDIPYKSYAKRFTLVEEMSHVNIKMIAVGSTIRAVVDNENNLYTWGANINGALGLGYRSKEIEVPTLINLPSECGTIVSLDCARGQPNPKNQFSDPSGQEGPRIHLVTEKGKLWIAGTCHKGLGADHFGKVMTSSGDHLTFYEVGGRARDVDQANIIKMRRPKSMHGYCLTGCFDTMPSEDFKCLLELKAVSEISERGVECLRDCGMKMNEDSQIDSGLNADRNRRYVCTKYFSGAHITKSAVGHIHSLALDDNGSVYGFGCGSNGRLGVPNFFKRDGSKRLMKCYVSTPSRVGQKHEKSRVISGNKKKDQTGKSLRDEKVQALAVGRYWSFAIVE